MKIGIGIGDLTGHPADMAELAKQAQQAEAAGFQSAWLANIFGADALTAATVCGLATERIELGTAIVPSYPRHPYAMAQQALSVNAATGNRLTLGIGLSHQIVIENMFGLSYAKSYSHMKEYLAVLAPLIRKGRVEFSGELFKVNASLRVPGAKPCPILIAALAPKMLALAGSVADGTITWMTGPKTLAEHTIPTIVAAAVAAERPAPRVVAGLPIAVTSDPQAAREAAARHFRAYGMLPSYRAMLDREGAAGPADVAIVGDEASVGAQLDRLAEAGVTDLLAAPFAVSKGDDSLERTWQLLSQCASRAS
ncbi:MAG TPA: TIGR03564 family F420-dependent LLM class oxidoreductase [Polyangiales bacterium]